MDLANGLEILQVDGDLDWGSDQNYYFLNPRLLEVEGQNQLKAIKNAGPFSGSLFLLTSGTTAAHSSRFKWVVLSKDAFLKSARAVNQAMAFDSQTSLSQDFCQDFQGVNDVWLHLLPDFHVGGLAVRARCYLSGAKWVTLSRWDVSEAIQAMERHQVTLLSLVPTQVFDLCQNQVRCPASVRTALVGGGALSPALYQRARELGWPIRMTYAMAEACSTVALTPLTPYLESSICLPDFEILPHWEVRSAESLWIKGESLLTAYIECDSGGKYSVFDPKVEGWLKTTDRGVVTGRSLQLLGRTVDLIKIGGEKVEMGRLQQILDGIRVQLSIIADLALLPFPDERLGHVIHLLSDERLSDAQAMAVRAAYDAQVLPFEKIRQWHRIDQIPRTDLRKLIISRSLEKVGGLGS